MRFVPAHKHADGAAPVISPAKWLVELDLVANDKGRETFVSHDRIHQILSPAIQVSCLLTPAQALLFPTPPFGGRLGDRLTPPPRIPLPTRPATPVQMSLHGPATPPNHTPPDNNIGGGLNPEVEYPPQLSLLPNTRGSCGNRHPTQGSYGRYCSELNHRIAAPPLGPMIHRFPTDPGAGRQTRLSHPTR